MISSQSLQKMDQQNNKNQLEREQTIFDRRGGAKADKIGNFAATSRVASKPSKNVHPIEGRIQPMGPMANVGGDFTTIVKWEIDDFAKLFRLRNEQYVQSPTFTSKGPYGGQQQLKWALRLFPCGAKGTPENKVSVFLHLLDGDGAKEVKLDYWKMAILNQKNKKVNMHDHNSCLFDPKNDISSGTGWGFEWFIIRGELTNADKSKKFLVDRHMLVLHCQIAVKAEKDLESELLQQKEQIRILKRKLAVKEEADEKIAKLEREIVALKKSRKDEQERYSNAEQQLMQEKCAAVNECKEEAARSTQLRLELKRCREAIANLQKEKSAEEEARKEWQEKHEKLYNHYVLAGEQFK